MAPHRLRTEEISNRGMTGIGSGHGLMQAIVPAKVRDPGEILFLSGTQFMICMIRAAFGLPVRGDDGGCSVFYRSAVRRHGEWRVTGRSDPPPGRAVRTPRNTPDFQRVSLARRAADAMLYEGAPQ
ncbi:hypothetical protein GCM10009414_27540 [Tatumella terrea]